ncbi:TetR/AcrR family transcriptional regulator [Mycobacterium sp. GA-2829]|uniref:TetR/AcrR family transcriptional regulator n=1 Tax=Mycobacterium sp. GA-2829 TaxID=1772283 RepID=UPI0018D25FB9|nr:TetR/AcrR family transcriptional regulator [Mycobacterium sp. GA-2829]
MGRPRDPDVDQRALSAAVSIFGEDGWSGFTIDAVARRAGVGKASIYRRWPDKERLLTAALEVHMGHLADVDTGSLRGDLIALARQLLGLYLGDAGRAAQRLAHEAPATPVLSAQYESLRRSQLDAARRIVRRGISRGETSADTPVNLLLDCLAGGVMNHVMATPPSKRGVLAAAADFYATGLVDYLLR